MTQETVEKLKEACRKVGGTFEETESLAFCTWRDIELTYVKKIDEMNIEAKWGAQGPKLRSKAIVSTPDIKGITGTVRKAIEIAGKKGFTYVEHGEEINTYV